MNADRPLRTVRAALGALCLAAGCGQPADDPSAQAALDPPPPGQGFQYTMASTLAPGQEIERCQFFTIPPEGLYVNHDLVRYTPGSHHVLLYMTPYTSIPTVDTRGRPHDTSSIFDCAEGATADWQVTGVLGGAQSRTADSLVSLPSDTAIKVPGGTVLLMNTHYLNATPSSLDSVARLNIYTIPKEQVKTEGGVIFFYNPFIRVPALGRASARMRCPVPTALSLVTAQSHMHRRGVGYGASLIPSGAPAQPFYTNTEWENVPVATFSPNMTLPAGSTIDYHCDYQNPEDRTVLQGFSTRDEMCMLIGSYYPRVPSFENCSTPTFVGSGTKGGAETLGCLQAAGGVADPMYGCVVDSCPGIADPLTAALMCQFSRGGGACDATCQADPNGCQTCVQQACQGQLGALMQASCT